MIEMRDRKTTFERERRTEGQREYAQTKQTKITAQNKSAVDMFVLNVNIGRRCVVLSVVRLLLLWTCVTV